MHVRIQSTHSAPLPSFLLLRSAGQNPEVHKWIVTALRLLLDFRFDVCSRQAMEQSTKPGASAAEEYARRLRARVDAICALHPDADPENVRHTLLLARMIASKRALNRPRDRLVLPVLEDTLRSTQQ